MIKFIELVKARPDRSVERFHFHWRRVHSPLVLMSRLTGYIQNHRIDDRVWDFRPTAYHGVLEVWTPDLEPLQESAFLDNAKPDEPNFGDMPNCAIDVGHDHVLKGTNARTQHAVRAFLAIRRRADIGVEQFNADLIGRIGKEIVRAVQPATQIIATLPVPDSPYRNAEYHDAHLGLTFPTLKGADAARVCSPALADTLSEIADLEGTTSMLTDQCIERAYEG